MGAASVSGLPLTGPEAKDEVGSENVEDTSCWTEEEEPGAEANRCSGGSEVRVEIQASSSTRMRRRALKSRVTSSPIPSIRAISFSNPC